MTDNQLRGIVLRKYYEKRREGDIQWTTGDFDEQSWPAGELFRICDQLAEHRLIHWTRIPLQEGRSGGVGQISAYGIDVVEGHVKPPIAITFDQSRNISVASSSNVQIGDSNIQVVTIQFERLIAAIDHASVSDVQKQEAKSLLKRFLEHPLVTSIVGGLASTIKL
jgi:hypothetical protein